MLQSKLRYHLTLQNFWWSHFKLRQKGPTLKNYSKPSVCSEESSSRPPNGDPLAHPRRRRMWKRRQSGTFPEVCGLALPFELNQFIFYLFLIIYILHRDINPLTKKTWESYILPFFALLGCGDLYWVWWTERQEGGTRKWDRHPHVK